jgi:Aldolase/RraA
MTERSDVERTALLRELYTGAVADILDDLGHREQCLPADIRPVSPEMKVAGPVYTVRGRARAYDDGTDPRFVQMDMLDGIFAGCVVVIDSGDEGRAAHWGELMSHTASVPPSTRAPASASCSRSIRCFEAHRSWSSSHGLPSHTTGVPALMSSHERRLGVRNAAQESSTVMLPNGSRRARVPGATTQVASYSSMMQGPSRGVARSGRRSTSVSSQPVSGPK